MVKNINKLTNKEIPNFKGGIGSVNLIKPDELPNNVVNYARITIHPHSSIGRHQHLDESELVYCLKGSGKVYDGSEYKELNENDINILFHGDHEIINDSEEELIILITIVKN